MQEGVVGDLLFQRLLLKVPPLRGAVLVAPGVGAQVLEVGREQDDGLRAAAVERRIWVEVNIGHPGGVGGAGAERGGGARASMRGAGALPDLPVSIWVGAVVGRVVMLGGDGVCGEESTIRIFTFLQ